MNNKPIVGVAIVGCGLIGRKRAAALEEARLISCADIVLERARSLAATTPGASATMNWQETIQDKDVDVVVVATTNNLLAEITYAAVQAGKHVLVEKPAARRTRELSPIIKLARQNGVIVRVGFNHRYHPAFRKARELYESGVLGELMFVRGRYGHGGRIGYEKEWRANPALSGGGELIDQGVHLIDLARWFLGEFDKVMGDVQTYYWQMLVDDNAFLLLKTSKQQVALLHVSCTEWKNLFSFEIYGKNAKLYIEGLGGSYGVERLYFYKMLPEMGPPETFIWEFPAGDDSWQLEFAEFLEDLRLNRQPSVGLEDARAALAIVEKIYADSSYDYNS
jgi:predicted dehydrogenase